MDVRDESEYYHIWTRKAQYIYQHQSHNLDHGQSQFGPSATIRGFILSGRARMILSRIWARALGVFCLDGAMAGRQGMMCKRMGLDSVRCGDGVGTPTRLLGA
jgi:hypothetical protein